MKNFKKLMALVIAAVMVVGTMSFMPGAATMVSNADKTVTVSGLETGDVAHFYKLVEWVGITTETQNDANVVSGWKAVAPYQTYLNGEKLKEILVGDTANGVEPTGITAEIAGDLAKITGATPTDVPESGGSASLTNLTNGAMYMVLITPKAVDTVYNPVFVSSDFFSDNDSNTWTIDESATYSSFSTHAAAKKSTLELTKTASAVEDKWDQKDGTEDDERSTAVGDKLSFTVETTIPGYGGVYTDPTFKITDKLTDLKLDKTSVKVFVPADSQTELAAANHFSLDPQDGGYTVEFLEGYLTTLTSATSVKITYDAIVTSSALKNVNLEDNQVTLEYSHDPSKENDVKVKKDTTQHYTFTIDAEGLGFGTFTHGEKGSEVIKVGLDGSGNPVTSDRTYSKITTDEYVNSPLANAEFTVYVDPVGNGNEADYVEYKPKNSDGTAGTTALKATTGDDGRLTISGLDAGTYYIKETKAPAGYIGDPNYHTIVIAAEYETIEVTEYWDGTKWNASKVNATDKAATYETDVLKSYTVTVDGARTTTHKFTNTSESTGVTWTDNGTVELPSSIINTKGVELPSTGGMGTTLFYAIGAILVLGAGILLVSKRRMSAN